MIFQASVGVHIKPLALNPCAIFFAKQLNTSLRLWKFYACRYR